MTFCLAIADEDNMLRSALIEYLNDSDALTIGPTADTLSELAAGEFSAIDVALVSSRLTDPELLADVSAKTSVLILLKQASGSDLVSALEVGAMGGVTMTSTPAALLANIEAAARGEACVPRGLLGGLLQRLIHRNRELMAADQKLASLSRREREVFALLGQGLEIDEIANRLVVTPQTVRTHAYNLMTKLGVHSRLEAVRLAQELGVANDSQPGASNAAG